MNIRSNSINMHADIIFTYHINSLNAKFTTI